MEPLQGSLTHFSVPKKTSRKYPVFTTADQTSSKAVIFIGGLFNGLGDVPYLPKLAEALKLAGWRLVLFHWSSAYEGFGTGSLDKDREEISALVSHLKENGLTTLILMGHSTGSQDVIHYLTTHPSLNVDGGIMQAPISDREFIELNMQKWMDMLPAIETMVNAGKGEETVEVEFVEGEPMKITAYRFYSLVSPKGDDDYFSTDLPLKPDGIHVHPLSTSFGRLTVPALALFSEKDEYSIPSITDPSVHLAKWREASNYKLDFKVIQNASHAVEGKEQQAVLAKDVVEWLQRYF